MERNVQVGALEGIPRGRRRTRAALTRARRPAHRRRRGADGDRARRAQGPCADLMPSARSPCRFESIRRRYATKAVDRNRRRHCFVLVHVSSASSSGRTLPWELRLAVCGPMTSQERFRLAQQLHKRAKDPQRQLEGSRRRAPACLQPRAHQHGRGGAGNIGNSGRARNGRAAQGGGQKAEFRIPRWSAPISAWAIAAGFCADPNPSARAVCADEGGCGSRLGLRRRSASSGSGTPIERRRLERAAARRMTRTGLASSVRPVAHGCAAPAFDHG